MEKAGLKIKKKGDVGDLAPHFGLNLLPLGSTVNSEDELKQ